MKKLLLLFITLLYVYTAGASEDGKTWPASKKAKQFVKDTIVIDFYALPFGIGWNKPEQLHTYMGRAIDAGITGSSITLAPTYFTWAQFIGEYNIWRKTMLETPERYVFVHSVEDIAKVYGGNMLRVYKEV